MEKIQVDKAGTSKFGSYLKSGDKFHGCTDQVKKFISGKEPCTVMVAETTGEGRDEKISKVQIVGASNNASFSNPNNPEVRINVDAGNMVQRATELIAAGKGDNIMSVTLECCAAFRAAKQELERPIAEISNNEPEIDPQVNENGEM